MTESKNSIVTTRTTYLDIVTFPVIVIESTFYSLPLGRYLFPLPRLTPHSIDTYPDTVHPAGTLVISVKKRAYQ